MWIPLVFTLLVPFFISNVFALDLVPIHNPTDPDGSLRRARRDASFTGELDLQDLETFFWGVPSGDKLVYANLTVYFPEEYEYVVAMERFENTLKSVDCSEDMMLEFVDKAAFNYAKSVWNWVSDDVNNSFVMVSNHEKCADDMERRPFVVSDIRYDDEHNKAYLTADLKEWEEVMHSYTLHVGNMPLTPTHRMLMARGVMKRESDFTFGLEGGYDQRLFEATKGNWTTSVDAVVRTVGSLNVEFDIDIDWFSLDSASMSVSPEGLAASLQLALSAEGTLREGYPWKETVLSIPVQGINLKGIIKLGAFVDVDVGFTMDEWAGAARANFGAKMEISNDAIVKVDLVNSDNNKFSGWMPSFSAIPLTLSAKIEGSARVYAEPNIKIEASVHKWGWNVALGMQMPYIEANFAAMFESSGVCDSKKTLGVDVDAKVGIDLSVQAATKGNEADPFWEQEIYANEWNLFSTCMAFGPEAAKTGEVVDDPNPASKTKKSETTKTTKSKTPTQTPTETPTSTKRPGSSSSKPSPKSTPKPTAPASTKVSKSEKEESTTSSRESSKTATEEASGTDTSKTSKPSNTDKPPSSNSQTTGDESSTSKPSGTPTDLSSSVSLSSSSSSSSFSTLSWKNTTRTGTPSSFSSASSLDSKVTQTPSSGEEEATATPGTLSSTFSTTTATNTTDPSPTQDPGESCPTSGCEDCKDSFDTDGPTTEYFSIEVDGPPPPDANLTRRAYREYPYTCDHITEIVRMADYPTFSNWLEPSSSINIPHFYQASDTADCLNHGISSTTSPAIPIGTPVFAMEHIYEGNWILQFLRHLESSSALPCDGIKSVFFDDKLGPTANTPWIKTVMAALGSTQNQHLLVFLRQNINGAKYRIFDAEHNNKIIADDTWDNADPKAKLEKLAVVGRAMDYMGQSEIGRRVKESAESVEKALEAVAAAARAQGNDELRKALGGWADAGKLKNEHREWLSSFMQSRNGFAQTKMMSWASEASALFDPTPTLQAGQTHTDKTLATLAVLQTAPPDGFVASDWL